jgi:hypothetical protein
MLAANPVAGTPSGRTMADMIDSARLAWRSSQVDERSGLPG